MENPPNQTLYINNLNEKVKKEGNILSANASLGGLTRESIIIQS